MCYLIAKEFDKQGCIAVKTRHGKANDDGYRGVHLYFQLDHKHYPIEIQMNTYYV